MELLPKIVELLITPPGIVVVLLFITFLVYMKSHWAGSMMLAFSGAVLVIVSLPLTAHLMLGGLQNIGKPLDLIPLAGSGPKAALRVPRGEEKKPPQAIVVLGAGRYSGAPEYDGEDTASPLGLERLRYAAHLQRLTGLPILVSGGRVANEHAAEASFMKQVLTTDFHASVKWVEDQSRNTQENAQLSAALLANVKVNHVYLVTHAWHMRRAARHFEFAGVRVTPAPTGFHTLASNNHGLLRYLPSAQGMYNVSLALHERLGLFWHEWQDSAGTPAPAASP